MTTGEMFDRITRGRDIPEIAVEDMIIGKQYGSLRSTKLISY